MLLIKKRVLHKNLNDMRLHFFYKKVGPSLQSCLYFQDDFFTYVCEEYNNFHDSRSIFMISDFKIFLIIFSAEFWCIPDLTATLNLFQSEKSTFR